MGIRLIIGNCGSGKSLQGALFCAEHMRKGRRVYSNMYLRGAYKLELDDLLNFDLGEDAVVYLDEAVSTGLGSRGTMYKKNTKDNIIEFMTMWRHYKVKDIIVVSPSFNDVLPIIRDNAEEIIFCKKSILNLIGLNKYKRISRHLTISEGQPSMRYEFVPFSTKYYRRKPAYELFDSFVKKDLPDKNWERWDNARDGIDFNLLDDAKPFSLLDKIKEFRRERSIYPLEEEMEIMEDKEDIEEDKPTLNLDKENLSDKDI